ncbi:unnamed protein product [Closterium sp. NIES-53]
MEVARTSMIHAAALRFLWPFAVRYAAHQLNLWPRVCLLETSPALHWTGKVGDASVLRVWGSRTFVRDTSADKPSARAIPCVFLGFSPDAHGWQFYHPTSRRVFPSQDVTLDESVPFYRLFPYRSAPPPPPLVFLAPSPPLVDPLPPQGPGPSVLRLGVLRLGVRSLGAVSLRVPGLGVLSLGVRSLGVLSLQVWSLGVLSLRVWSLGLDLLAPAGVESAGAESGATGARDSATGDIGAGGAGVTAGAGGNRGAAAAAPGSARTRGSGAAGTGSVGGVRAGDSTEPGAGGARGTGAGGAGAQGAGSIGTGAGGTGSGGAGAGGDGPLLQPASTLPAPSPYTELSGGLIERREPASRSAYPVRTGRRVPCPRPSPVPGTHAMALRPSSIPLRVPLPPPPASSLPAIPDPESDRACATSPTVSHLLATDITDPSFQSTAAYALVAELVDFAAACRLDYATTLVAESACASPPSVGGEYALGTYILEDKQEDFECLAAAVPRFASTLLAPEGDPDAPNIPTPRSYAEAITGPYSSQWQAAMDAKMASWLSTGTYVDAVPLCEANIVDGMWIFRVKRPPGSPPYFKTRYVARGFSQGQGVDYFHNFSPTPKMSAQGDLAAPPTRLHWVVSCRTTLAALGFTPSTADPSLFLRIDMSLSLLYVLVYVDDLVFATAYTEALTLVKSELQKRHTCTDLGELRSYLGLQITRNRAWRTITLTQSHMVHQVLQRFGFQFFSPQPTPLSTSHSLSAPPSDKSVEPSGPYLELVGCLMYLMTCTRPDLAYPLSLLARYVAPDASWVHDSGTQRSSQGYTFSLGSGSVSWRSTRPSSVLSSSCEAEIYAMAMAAQQLQWLTYLLTHLGEQPCSPPVLYVDDKAMIALYIPTPRSYAEAITGPYSSLWQAAMDSEMASWKSTGTYIDAIPPSRAIIVNVMWIFRVKRPPGSPPAFKARYVARGFSQGQLDYELHSLDFSTAFLKGSLHEEIWLRRPPGFTGSFPVGTQWSIRRPVYGLHQAPREWHDTLRTTHAALGFTPTADRYCFYAPTRRCRRSTSSCTTSSMGLVLGGWGLVVLTGHADASWVHDSAMERSSQVYTFTLGSGSISWWSTRPSSVLSSCCEAEIYAGAMAAQELRWLTYLLSEFGEQPRSPPILYVDNKAMIALCQEHRTKHIALRYFLARELQPRGQLCLAYVATRANYADLFTKALPPGDHQRFSTVLGLVPNFPHLLSA